jgi:pimeloyl-ACP methyl ester carboxylesterase
LLLEPLAIRQLALPNPRSVYYGDTFSEDPATPLDKREAVSRLYPQAKMKVVEGASHGMAVTHREDYYATIDAFLAS